MSDERRTLASEAATTLILSTFRANGALLEAGDLLAAREGLTSSRWQVLGAISLAGRPLTVPQIARRMGLTRQSVHATVQRLVRDGHVELTTNADHARSSLVALSAKGRATYDAIDRRQAAWADRLARGLKRAELGTAARVLDELVRRLEVDGERRSAPRAVGAGT
jgi:DNA-binding MarR family transcriptional regulator